MVNSKKICKTATRAVSTALVAVLVLFALLVVGIRMLGLNVYMVLSPSMEPDIKTGSLIYVRDVQTNELEVGDVITFRLVGDTTATHRIYEIVPHEDASDVLRFRTKGDNNPSPDASLVHEEDIIGTPVLIIPYLGYAVNFVQSPLGMVICVCAALFLIVLTMLLDTIFGEDEKETSDEKQNQDESAGDGSSSESKNI